MTEKVSEERGPGLEEQETSAASPVDAAVSDEQRYGKTDGEWATSLEALDGETATALLQMTRAMYPHDRIPDLHYARVVEELDKKAAADGAMSTLLHEGVASLSAVAGEPFTELNEREKVEALEKIQGDAFFEAVATEAVTGLYSQHDVWPYFGYEGPSNHLGGYLYRGFDDIDWLDRAPDRRGSQPC